MSDDNAVDLDFTAGFEGAPAPTPTPVIEKKAADPAVVDPKDTPAVAEPEPPKYAQITEQQYQDLLNRAASIDEIKTETKRLFDSAFGKLGNQQQLLERLQSTTQAGQPIEVSEKDFEELVNEGYSDLAQMQAAGLNRILAKLKLRGTGEPSASFDPEKVGEVFTQRFTPERAALKQEIRQELAHEALTEAHDDWEKVVSSTDFGDWAKANGTYDKKDRSGALFAESIDARFVAKVLSDFKESRKKTSARQDLLKASVTPRGTAGPAAAPSEDDDFHQGFKS